LVRSEEAGVFRRSERVASTEADGVRSWGTFNIKGIGGLAGSTKEDARKEGAGLGPP